MTGDEIASGDQLLQHFNCHLSETTCRTSVTLTWAPPESVEGSPVTRYNLKSFPLIHSLHFNHCFRFTVQQKAKDSESRTIGHTGGDLLTYRVDGLLPRWNEYLASQLFELIGNCKTKKLLLVYFRPCSS